MSCTKPGKARGFRLGRLGRALIALAVGVVTIPVVTSGNNAAFAATPICEPEVNIFGVEQDGDLFVYKHQDPENGSYAWGSKTYIGTGWQDGRTLAGPDGAMYLFRAADGGELRRYRYNGAGWDLFNGGQFQSVGSGWGRYNTPEHRNKITIDEKERIYEISSSGQLKIFIWDKATNGWLPGTGGGKVIDSGWGQYDSITAAGDGVLYARKPTGEFQRFRYHFETDRWLQYAKPVGWGWNIFNRVFSVGGDVLYGTRNVGAGELLWYRYNEDTDTWEDSGRDVGKHVGDGWYGEYEVVGASDHCKLPSFPVPSRPTVPGPNHERAHMLYNTTTQRLEVFFVGNDGILRRGYQSSAGTETLEWQGLSGFQNFTGRATAALRQDGKLVAFGHSSSDADVRSFTQSASGSSIWTGPENVKGAFASSPILLRGAGDLLTAFAVAGDGQLWFASQATVDSGFMSWRKAVGSGGVSSQFTVLRSGNDFEVVYRTAAGVVEVKKLVNGSLGAARVAGGVMTDGIPSAVVFADGKVQLVARGTDNKLYTQKETATGFGGWTNISGGFTFKGSPAALLNAHGIVEVVARESDNTVRRSGQTAPGSSAWRIWETNFDQSVTDPTFTAVTGNEQRIFYIDGNGNYYLLQANAYTSDSGTRMTTNGKQSKKTDNKAVTGQIK
ncbi:hypothetical protein JOF56_004199 [Kibdelosporangium banguiense]|uniref:Tachylectin n=1 Tax=Kibdelosporangium banguiense TaxID=1365924 RepID=A0ABS4TIH4_9PSEU|nr:tachylectin-related carbohydrate-binding protein [Kibdelosporangium banguiense]MBP2323814.1 hypothetical protein [Kibdelosporangium banguiense]